MNALLWYWRASDLAEREKAGAGAGDYVFPAGAFDFAVRIDLDRYARRIPSVFGEATLALQTGGWDD